MKTRLYAIRDHKTGTYGDIMGKTTDGAILRELSDAVNTDDPKNALNRHSDDFELFYLGEYDNESGTITAEPPKSVVTATQLKK